MSHDHIHKLVRASLFAALCTIMTLVIQVPSPMQGYVNLGDCAVLLSAWVLGPWYGGAAAGVGSMLADLLSGYAHYAPGTFAVKLAMAVAAGCLFRALRNKAIQPLPAQLADAYLKGNARAGGYLVEQQRNRFVFQNRRMFADVEFLFQSFRQVQKFKYILRSHVGKAEQVTLRNFIFR